MITGQQHTVELRRICKTFANCLRDTITQSTQNFSDKVMPKFSHDNIFYHLIIDFVSKHLMIAFVFFNKFKDFYKFWVY